jgi:hypothetical protein
LCCIILPRLPVLSRLPVCPQVCRGKGVQMELVLMQAAQQAQQGQQQEQEGGGDASDAQAATAAAAAAAEVDASDARAAAWEAAEAAFPHLSVTIVQGASKLSFDCLASTLLQRFAGQPQLAVNLQVGRLMASAVLCVCMRWASALITRPHRCACCLCCLPPYCSLSSHWWAASEACSWTASARYGR